MICPQSSGQSKQFTFHSSDSSHFIDPTIHIFIRTDAEAPILWPLDAKSWLIRKDPDAGKDWRQKGMTEDEMAAWHHWLNGHKFEQVPGDGEWQGSLACYSPWGHKESETTEQLNNNHTHRASQVALVVKNLPANAGDIRHQRLSFDPWIKIPWRRKRQSTTVFLSG